MMFYNAHYLSVYCLMFVLIQKFKLRNNNS